MLIVLEKRCPEKIVSNVKNKVRGLGLRCKLLQLGDYRLLLLSGFSAPFDPGALKATPGIKEIVDLIGSSLLLSSRAVKKNDIVVSVGGVKIGAGHFTVIAGPCSIEDERTCLQAAKAVKKAGAAIFRGGIFKPRTSPYSFQGLGEKGLGVLRRVKRETGLPVVTEVMDERSLDCVYDTADLLQIGARSMYNYPLLKLAGKARKPVMLKRAPYATIKEWLFSAEYILKEGNSDVVLCERGTRSAALADCNTLDLGVMLAAKEQTRLPVIADPSHGTRKSDRVIPMALAAAAAGAHGLMVEVHPRPEHALSDGKQALSPAAFKTLMMRLRSFLQ